MRMSTRNMFRFRAVPAAAAALAALLAVAAPAQAGGQPATTGPGDRVVQHDHEHSLANASLVRVQGTPTDDGGCRFSFPELRLRPGETAIAARQVSTNYTDCSTVVETGVPASSSRSPAPAGGAWEVAPGGSVAAADTSPDNGVTAVSSSGYQRVWWEDAAHWDVHRVRTNLSWTWDPNTCLIAASWSGDYWALWTGWSKVSSSIYPLQTSCSLVWVANEAEFSNSTVCLGTVRSYYRTNAEVWSNGTMVGRVTNTWTTYPHALCPRLHYHHEVIRLTG